MTKPSGVIFDFDGVVVDSLEVHLKAWRLAFLNIYNYELADTSGLAGRSTEAIARILADRAGKPATATHLAEEKRRELKTARHLITALPGALEAFSILESHGIPFGIASNAPRAFIEQTLEALSVRVQHVLGVDDVLRPKPAPDVFLLCARRIGVKFTDHHRTLVFEDSVHGIQAAVTAGMYPIGVTTQHSTSELSSGGAKKTCVHILEALENGWLINL
jgi:beta-phosphoglucomutase